MPKHMTLIQAKDILRGHGNPSTNDVLAAGQRLHAELQRLYLIEVWARRLTEAPDQATAERARQHLADALNTYPPGTEAQLSNTSNTPNRPV